jgi:CRP-like cAMP-binding protein
MLKLRIALIGVALVYIVWGFAADNMSAVLWNISFAAVHTYQLIRLWNQRRSIELTSQEDKIHRRLFPDLDLIDFYTLWSMGDVRTIPAGQTLIDQGDVQDTLMLIVSGQVSVERDGNHLADLSQDDLLGERSYMTGEVASATVRANSEVEIHVWDQRRMKALVDLSTPAHESMVRYISADLARKL